MTSRLCLLVLICTANHVLGQSYDGMPEPHPEHGWGGGRGKWDGGGGGGGMWGGGGGGGGGGMWEDGHWGNKNSSVMEGFLGESHVCQTYFNVQVNMTTYPDCPPQTSCERRCSWVSTGYRRYWPSGKWVCTRDSCCATKVSVLRVEAKNMTVCCDGYTSGPRGQRCNKPICSNKCADNKTTCIAPNTCGPACYPACRNGGTCQDGTPNNTCTCTTGWMGPACDMAVQCTATGANVCQNGGVCTNGRCGCAEGYVGNLCDQALCTSRCLNDGICTAPDTCQCVNGFSGANCELPPTGGATP